MDKRLKLHETLQSLLGNCHVYYNPPETVRMKYPCIIYHKSDVSKLPADDIGYLRKNGYLVTVVDFIPDSPIAAKVEQLPMCTFSNIYVADNLYHTAYKLFY